MSFTDTYRPEIKEREGVYHICGHGGNGLTNGIITGKTMAEHCAHGKEIPEIYR